ncbi:MAG: hypothetical protein EBE86_026620 [Hormoscilla sp. GUM202]|nr:hypothetical protein [Hormoscilla sp. GUM202]
MISYQKMSRQQISKLNPDKLPDFPQWKKVNNDDFSLWDYLFGVANVELAIAFTQLFWPDTLEHEGGIFLSSAFDRQIYEQWKAKLGNGITSIEQVINHQHIDDMLPGSEAVGTENIFYLGKAIAQMWESRLKLLYPQRRFEVNCDRVDYSVVVTFHQVREYRC